VDIPEALGMVAPRRLEIKSVQPAAFDRTRRLYDLAGGSFKMGGAE